MNEKLKDFDIDELELEVYNRKIEGTIKICDQLFEERLGELKWFHNKLKNHKFIDINTKNDYVNKYFQYLRQIDCEDLTKFK